MGCVQGGNPVHIEFSRYAGTSLRFSEHCDMVAQCFNEMTDEEIRCIEVEWTFMHKP